MERLVLLESSDYNVLTKLTKSSLPTLAWIQVLFSTHKGSSYCRRRHNLKCCIPNQINKNLKQTPHLHKQFLCLLLKQLYCDWHGPASGSLAHHACVWGHVTHYLIACPYFCLFYYLVFTILPVVQIAATSYQLVAPFNGSQGFSFVINDWKKLMPIVWTQNYSWCSKIQI